MSSHNCNEIKTKLPKRNNTFIFGIKNSVSLHICVEKAEQNFQIKNKPLKVKTFNFNCLQLCRLHVKFRKCRVHLFFNSSALIN